MLLRGTGVAETGAVEAYGILVRVAFQRKPETLAPQSLQEPRHISSVQTPRPQETGPPGASHTSASERNQASLGGELHQSNLSPLTLLTLQLHCGKVTAKQSRT